LVVSALELLGVAGSLSLLAGWRLYATVLAIGLVQKLGWWDAPLQLETLRVFSHEWVLVAACAGTVAEFFADKIPWVDSVWDTVHTIVRPLGGALIALALVDPSQPLIQVLAFLLGGGAALVSHGAKAGARAAINTSPEPFSNIGMSLAEDAATAGGLWLAFNQPWLAFSLILCALAVVLLLAWAAWRALRRLTRADETPTPDT
jgi:Domain of unknown function (DUF4126)